jgi:hypothetical protein
MYSTHSGICRGEFLGVRIIIPAVRTMQRPSWDPEKGPSLISKASAEDDALVNVGKVTARVCSTPNRNLTSICNIL